MKLSSTAYESVRITKLDEMFPAQDLLLQTGQIVQYASGIFAYNNVPLRVMENIKKIIRDVFDEAGLVEVSLPVLQPESLWQESGRWDKYIADGTMLVVKTDKGNYGLAPTAEEAIVALAKGRVKSYKSLPVTFYQIGDKYRNEIRNRGYLMRGKQFVMLDAYSFDTDKKGLQKTYDKLRTAYIEIFKRIGIAVTPVVQKDTGEIGGDTSEEFMHFHPAGEDIVDGKKCIELGHIFQLGTKYSKSMNVTFQNANDKPEHFHMGCYGIGVSRLLAVIYENSIKDGVISLPESIAPYKYHIVYSEERKSDAMKFYAKNPNSIIDDRLNVSFGVKIKDAGIFGTPYTVIFGKKSEGDNYEIQPTRI